MSLKQFTRAEVENSDKKTTRFIIHDKVYDVTPFLNEHPGGEEILLDHGGKDASADFDDVGHSMDAFDIMKKYLVGEIVESERKGSAPKKAWTTPVSYKKESNEKQISGPGLPFTLLVIGIFVVIMAFIYYQ